MADGASCSVQSICHVNISAQAGAFGAINLVSWFGAIGTQIFDLGSSHQHTNNFGWLLGNWRSFDLNFLGQSLHFWSLWLSMLVLVSYFWCQRFCCS
jgi:hypothetical protein